MNLVIPKEIRKYIDNQNFQIDLIGKSKAKKMILDDCVLKIESSSDEVKNEVLMLNWWNNYHLPVPEILENIQVEGINYLLMEKLKGDPSYEVIVRRSTEDLIELLADSLKLLWNVDITHCPSSQLLEDKLAAAKERVEKNLVDVNDADEGTFGEDGFNSPEALWDWLDNNRPEEEKLVLSHGDFSLPNLIASGSYLTGFIDLGQSGVSDIYQDIALCYRSLLDNLRGKFGVLRTYTEYEVENYGKLFFQKIGIEPDWDKIKYYILLDELF